MKPGDMIGWSTAASEWSDGPEAHTYVGIVTRVMMIPTRPARRRRRARVEYIDGGELFIISRDLVEVIQ